MAGRDITVTFADGSKQVYQGVPDDVKPEQIQARAQKENSGKQISAIDRAAPKRKFSDYLSMGSRAITETAGDVLGMAAPLIPGLSMLGQGASNVVHHATQAYADKFGMEKPETNAEKLAVATGKGAAMALIPGGGGSKAVQAVSGGLSGASGELAKQAGLPEWAQVAASLAGGFAPTVAGSVVRHGATKVKSFIDGGGERAANTLQTAAGSPQAARTAQTRIAASPKPSPGTAPTTGELAGNDGLAALQRQHRTTDILAQQKTNAQARAATADNAMGAGDPLAMQGNAQRTAAANETALEAARTKIGPVSERVNDGADVRNRFQRRYDIARGKSERAYNNPVLEAEHPLQVTTSMLDDMRATAGKFYGNGGGLMPKPVEDVLREAIDHVANGTFNTRTLTNFDRRLAEFAGQAKVAGSRADAKFANSMRDILDSHTGNMLPKDYSTALANAKMARADQGRRFEQGRIGQAFKDKAYGAHATADGELPGALARTGPTGGTMADQLKAAIGDTASEATVRAELRRLSDAGKLKTTTQVGNFKELLKRFPNLKSDVEAVQSKAALNEAFAGSKLGGLVDSGVDPSAHISKLLTSDDGGRAFGELAKQITATGDKATLNGLRRAVAEHVTKSSKGTMLDSAGRNIPSQDAAIKALDAVLKNAGDVLTPQQRTALGGIRREMAGANYAEHAGLHRPAHPAGLPVPAKAAWVARTIKSVINHMTNAGKVDKLIEAAILDPSLAVELLGRKTPDRLKKIMDTVKASAIGSAAGAVQVGGSE